MAGDPKGFTAAGYPAAFKDARPTPAACDYDAAHGVPAGHPTARTASSNMVDERAKRTKPVDREQNSGGAGVSFPNFKGGK